MSPASLPVHERCMQITPTHVYPQSLGPLHIPCAGMHCIIHDTRAGIQLHAQPAEHGGEPTVRVLKFRPLF